MPGYHIKDITKGKLGEFSKIREEFAELEDAFNQDNLVLQIVEACDLIGAIEAYFKNKSVTIDNLLDMMESTKKAFIDGTRK